MVGLNMCDWMFLAIRASYSLAVRTMRAGGFGGHVKVNVNKVDDKVNDIYSIHSHYKGIHKRGAAAEGRGTSFVVAAKGRHLCSGYE